jgi:hypothetical protein
VAIGTRPSDPERPRGLPCPLPAGEGAASAAPWRRAAGEGASRQADASAVRVQPHVPTAGRGALAPLGRTNDSPGPPFEALERACPAQSRRAAPWVMSTNVSHPVWVYHVIGWRLVRPFRAAPWYRCYPGRRPSLPLRAVALGYPWCAPLGRSAPLNTYHDVRDLPPTCLPRWEAQGTALLPPAPREQLPVE